MNLLFYGLGVLLIFLTKLLVNNKSGEPTEGWKRVFEVPTDLTLLSFMMGIAGTASLEKYTRSTQVVMLLIIALSVLSVAIYKSNCTTVSDKGGIVQFDNAGKSAGLFVVNVIISAFCIYISYTYLGADAS